MEYCSPESMVLDAEGKYRALTREVDMWALGECRGPLISTSSSLADTSAFPGIILYKLLFLKLPYAQIDDFDSEHIALCLEGKRITDGGTMQSSPLTSWRMKGWYSLDARVWS